MLTDRVLYAQIAEDSHVRLLSVLLWLSLGLSIAFLFYDFNAYAGMRRENLELDNAIYSDALTGIANRYSVDAYIGQFLGKPLPADIGCVTLDLINLTQINAALGHTGGDAAIQDFSAALQDAATGVCFIGRNGGNKFVAIFRDCSRKRLDTFLNNLQEQVDKRNADGRQIPILYSIGTAFEEGERINTLTQLIALSDRRAYENSPSESAKEE